MDSEAAISEIKKAQESLVEKPTKKVYASFFPSGTGSSYYSTYGAMINKILQNAGNNGVSLDKLVCQIKSEFCVDTKNIKGKIRNTLKRMMAMGFIYPQFYTSKMHFKLSSSGEMINFQKREKKREKAKHQTALGKSEKPSQEFCKNRKRSMSLSVDQSNCFQQSPKENYQSRRDVPAVAAGPRYRSGERRGKRSHFCIKAKGRGRSSSKKFKKSFAPSGRAKTEKCKYLVPGKDTFAKPFISSFRGKKRQLQFEYKFSTMNARRRRFQSARMKPRLNCMRRYICKYSKRKRSKTKRARVRNTKRARLPSVFWKSKLACWSRGPKNAAGRQKSKGRSSFRTRTKLARRRRGRKNKNRGQSLIRSLKPSGRGMSREKSLQSPRRGRPEKFVCKYPILKRRRRKEFTEKSRFKFKERRIQNDPIIQKRPRSLIGAPSRCPYKPRRAISSRIGRSKTRKRPKSTRRQKSASNRSPDKSTGISPSCIGRSKTRKRSKYIKRQKSASNKRRYKTRRVTSKYIKRQKSASNKRRYKTRKVTLKSVGRRIRRLKSATTQKYDSNKCRCKSERVAPNCTAKSKTKTRAKSTRRQKSASDRCLYKSRRAATTCIASSQSRKSKSIGRQKSASDRSNFKPRGKASRSRRLHSVKKHKSAFDKCRCKLRRKASRTRRSKSIGRQIFVSKSKRGASRSIRRLQYRERPKSIGRQKSTPDRQMTSKLSRFRSVGKQKSRYTRTAKSAANRHLDKPKRVGRPKSSAGRASPSSTKFGCKYLEPRRGRTKKSERKKRSVSRKRRVRKNRQSNQRRPRSMERSKSVGKTISRSRSKGKKNSSKSKRSSSSRDYRSKFTSRYPRQERAGALSRSRSRLRKKGNKMRRGKQKFEDKNHQMKNCVKFIHSKRSRKRIRKSVGRARQQRRQMRNSSRQFVCRYPCGVKGTPRRSPFSLLRGSLKMGSLGSSPGTSPKLCNFRSPSSSPKTPISYFPLSPNVNSSKSKALSTKFNTSREPSVNNCRILETRLQNIKALSRCKPGLDSFKSYVHRNIQKPFLQSQSSKPKTSSRYVGRYSNISDSLRKKGYSSQASNDHCLRYKRSWLWQDVNNLQTHLLGSSPWNKKRKKQTNKQCKDKKNIQAKTKT